MRGPWWKRVLCLLAGDHGWRPLVGESPDVGRYDVVCARCGSVTVHLLPVVRDA